MCSIWRLHSSPAHCQAKNTVAVFSICSFPGTSRKHGGKDGLILAFSVTLRCAAAGRRGINLLVLKQGTLNGLVGEQQASSRGCGAIHLRFCVSSSSLPAAVGIIQMAPVSHQVALTLEFHRRWPHYKFSNLMVK